MYRNYLIIAFRTLVRDKLFSLINVLGLAIGIAASIMILQYVVYEYSYDDFHVDKDRIYRMTNHLVLTDPDMDIHSAYTRTLLGRKLLEDFPEVEEMLRIDYVHELSGAGSTLQFIDSTGTPKILTSARGITADSNFFSFFSFPLISGDPLKVLRKPETALISESMARTWFPGEDPVGKVLTHQFYIELKTHQQIIIEGVFADIPGNSHLAFDYVVSNLDETGHVYDDWRERGPGHQTYVKLIPQANISEIEKRTAPITQELFAVWANTFKADPTGWIGQYHLQALRDIHLSPGYVDEYQPRQNPVYLNLLSLVSILILLISLANYINLSTAKALNRRREVGIRKVVGARHPQLITQFMLESFLLVSVAFVLAITLIQLGSGLFNGLINWQDAMVMWQSPDFFPYLLGTYLTCGILAGTYPAFVLARFQPTTILRGDKPDHLSGLTFRKSLVVIQFIATISIIIFCFSMYRQLVYLQDQDIGFQKEQLLVIPAPKLNGKGHPGFSRFETAVNRLVGVRGVAGSYSIPGDPSVVTMIAAAPENPNHNQRFHSSGGVSHDFLEVYGIPLLQGRNFDRNRGTDSTAIIVSEKATALLGYKTPSDALGQVWLDKTMGLSNSPARVIGIIPDYQLSSFHQVGTSDRVGTRGIVLCLAEGKVSWARAYMFFTLKVDPATVSDLLPQLEQQYSSLFPGHPFAYFFFDDQFALMYQSDEQFRNLFAGLAVLAVILAALGLFGLTLFNAQRRTREIGIRKVCGATIQDILKLLAKDYFRLILLSAIIAIPLSTVSTLHWQKNFVLQMPLSLDLYLLPILLVLLIATLTMLGQTFRAARNNPAESLRS